MARLRSQKIKLAAEVAPHFQKAGASIVAEYSGITAGELADLRRELRAANCTFKVVKNRVAKKAIENQVPESAELKSWLRGPVGVTFINGDVAQGAKAVFKFAKEHEAFKITGGILDGKSLNKEDLEKLSDLPSKEVLLAKIIGSMVSPHRGLLLTINGVSAKLVRVIAAIRDTKK